MISAWFYLWLGVALIGVSAGVLALWWGQRRFQSGIVTIPFALVLLGLGIEQIVLAGAEFGDSRALDNRLFGSVAAMTAVCAALFWLALSSRRGRTTIRESAERPRRVRELEALAAITRLSSQEGSVEEVGTAILDAARPVVGADCCILLLLDQERSVLLGKAASGMPDDSWRTFEIGVSDRFNQALLSEGRPLVVQDVEDEGQLKMTLARHIGARSALVAPLRHENRPLGTVTFYALGVPRAFDSVAITLSELIANEAADVLERARLKEVVLEERERAARVLAHVGDGVFLVDGDGCIRLWNQAAAAITGVPAEQAVGSRPAEALSGWEGLAPLIPVASAPESAARHAEALPLELEGRELWISISAVLVPDGTIYAFRDITEERSVERLKSDFVATVSHELRTPLAAVYGAAMTLRRADIEVDAEKRDRLLAVIASESDRLARIVNEVLTASRLEAGAFPLVLESCDPAALAREVVDAARLHASDGIGIELSADDGMPLIAADRDMVRQVLANLLDNAIKYSPAGGRVHLTLERQEGRVLFAVRDEGLGIPLNEQDRIFEKFYRLDPHLTRGVGGTGLGLYICRELVRRMGGRIWVASREREGSTFFFELPLARDGRPTAPSAARATAAS